MKSADQKEIKEFFHNWQNWHSPRDTISEESQKNGKFHKIQMILDDLGNLPEMNNRTELHEFLRFLKNRKKSMLGFGND